MEDNPRSPVPAIARFALDWFLIAPMALLLAVIVGGFLRADLIGPQVQSGALITYGLAFYLAFYEDLPTSKWHKGGRILGFVAVLVRFVHVSVVGLSVVAIVLVLTLGAFALDSSAQLKDFLLIFGLAMVGLGAAVGISGVATRIAEERF